VIEEPATAMEDEALVPISALQHFVFCPRQCALIHLEGQWLDNRLTVEGTELHERVDESGRRHETRGDVRIARRLDLRCRRLGLIGRADVVEMHRLAPEQGSGAVLEGVEGRWRPFPVEYKRGRPKLHEADRVQLCAQALCFEEMLGVPVPAGTLFYGQTRRRTEVEFDHALRSITEDTVRAVHGLFTSGHVPRAERAPKCRRCSLEPICLPDITSGRRSASRYLASAVRQIDALAPGR
jgi:CRISPR-associated exonuclease Cas4